LEVDPLHLILRALLNHHHLGNNDREKDTMS
jgi:hypothetical protein